MNSDVTKGEIEPIVIHFDVPGNEIPLSTFIETASSTKALIASFNHEVFSGRLSFQLLVLPPSGGSFKSNLGISVLAVGGIFWTTMESDVGKAFIKGLTSHEPSYWAEAAGSEVRERLVKLVINTDTFELDKSEKDGCNFAASILAKMTKSFLTTSTSELESIGIGKEKYRAPMLLEIIFMTRVSLFRISAQ